MADYLTTDTELASIAGAIRTKGGTSAQLTYPAGFVSAINALPSGGGATWTEHIDPNNPVSAQHFNITDYVSDSSTVWTARIEDCDEHTIGMTVESVNNSTSSGIIDMAGIGVEANGSFCWSDNGSLYWLAYIDPYGGYIALYQLYSEDVGVGDFSGDVTSFKTLG